MFDHEVACMQATDASWLLARPESRSHPDQVRRGSDPVEGALRICRKASARALNRGVRRQPAHPSTGSGRTDLEISVSVLLPIWIRFRDSICGPPLIPFALSLSKGASGTSGNELLGISARVFGRAVTTPVTPTISKHGSTSMRAAAFRRATHTSEGPSAWFFRSHSKPGKKLSRPSARSRDGVGERSRR